MHTRLFAQRQVRVCASDRAIGVNTIARLEVFHTRSHGFDDAGRVRPRRVRQIRLSGVGA